MHREPKTTTKATCNHRTNLMFLLTDANKIDVTHTGPSICHINIGGVCPGHHTIASKMTELVLLYNDYLPIFSAFAFDHLVPQTGCLSVCALVSYCRKWHIFFADYVEFQYQPLLERIVSVLDLARAIRGDTVKVQRQIVQRGTRRHCVTPC